MTSTQSNNNDTALELLVRTGYPVLVQEYIDSNNFDEEQKTAKIAEALVYNSVNRMWADAEGGIDSNDVCQRFNVDRVSNYFSKTNNHKIIGDILDVLKAGTGASMEAYAQIASIDVLGVESFAGAIRRNIEAPGVRDKVTKLVDSGYWLVFCPHDIDAEQVNHYFSILKDWKEFIDPVKMTERAISNFDEPLASILSDDEDNYESQFFYAALDKLIELTDKTTVSKIFHKEYSDCKGYAKLVKDGKLDSYIEPQTKKTANLELDKAINTYVKDYFPNSESIDKLAKSIKTDAHRKYLSEKMGEWVVEHELKHLKTVLTYKNTIYDLETAKQSVGRNIAQLIQSEKLGAVVPLFKDLPENLIDTANPELSGFVTAYGVYHEISRRLKEQRESR